MSVENLSNREMEVLSRIRNERDLPIELLELSDAGCLGKFVQRKLVEIYKSPEDKRKHVRALGI